MAEASVSQYKPLENLKPLGKLFSNRIYNMIYTYLHTISRVRNLDPGSQSAQALQDRPDRPLLSFLIPTTTAPATRRPAYHGHRCQVHKSGNGGCWESC